MLTLLIRDTVPLALRVPLFLCKPIIAILVIGTVPVVVGAFVDAQLLERTVHTDLAILNDADNLVLLLLTETHVSECF